MNDSGLDIDVENTMQVATQDEREQEIIDFCVEPRTRIFGFEPSIDIV